MKEKNRGLAAHKLEMSVVCGMLRRNFAGRRYTVRSEEGSGKHSDGCVNKRGE